MGLASDRASRTLCGTLDAGVCGDLVLVVSNSRLSNWADIFRASLQHVGVVGRQNGGRSTNNGAESIVELLSLGLLDSFLQCGAGGGFARGLLDVGVLVEVVVVVGSRAYDGALCTSVRTRLLAQDRVLTYSLAVDIEVDLWVIRRENAVGSSNNWAGSHGFCRTVVCERVW